MAPFLSYSGYGTEAIDFVMGLEQEYVTLFMPTHFQPDGQTVQCVFSMEMQS